MKKLFQFLFFLSVGNSLYAQTFTAPNFADIDTSFRTYVRQVFGTLEANRVPTGLLADFAFDFTDPKIYNGSVLVDSTLMEQGIYSELYKTIFTSKFNSSAGTLRHPSVHDSLCYIARQKEVITLSGLLFKYNAVDPNALANGKMQTVNGQLKDVYLNGVWQNPYQEFTTIAISPSITKYSKTNCSVVLPSNLFLSNRSSEISNIQFDAADGQGYRIIQYNTPVNLNYADTGMKHWLFKITLTSGQQLFSHSKVYFSNISNMAGSNRAAGRGTLDYTQVILAAEQYNGTAGVADIYISYHSSMDKVIRRPLIVAEGLDAGWITDPEDVEGTNTFAGFIASVRNSRSIQLTNLISNDPSIYDIIYINWRNGTDYLQRNELVLEAVIRWVNNNKQPLVAGGALQPNVVLGSSMGGVIARMALGRMDRGGGLNGSGGYAAHQTNLFVSLDAPQQGADVPLGFQALARHATRIYISTGLVPVVEVIQLIRNQPSPLLNLLLVDQPAPKQLLNNRIDVFYNSANSINQQFYQDLRSQWAYPANIRCIAISDGSECAIDQEFAPGATLLHHYRSTKTRFIGDLAFMAAGVGLLALNVSPLIAAPLLVPGSNKFELTLDIKALANGGGNAVYYANIKLTKKVLWLVPVSLTLANKTYIAPSGLLPIETYPGGFYYITKSLPGAASQDWFFTYDNTFTIIRRFSFIKTTSALDIGGGNTALTSANYLAKYIGATPPASPYNTPFANFTTAFNKDGSSLLFDNDNSKRLNNEPHEGLYLRTADWLAEELNGNQNVRTNCSFFCNPAISGSSLICTSQTYTLPGIPAGATVTWSASPSNVVNLVPNGTSVTATKVNNGVFTLTATITQACIGTLTLTKPNIYVGPPTLSSNGYTNTFDNSQNPLAYYPGGTNPACTRYDVITNIQSPSASTYTWSKISSTSVVNWAQVNNNNDIQFYLQAAGNQATFQLVLGNACGSLTNQFRWVAADCGSGGACRNAMTVSPNPAKTSAKVVVPDYYPPCNKPAPGQPVVQGKHAAISIITLYTLGGKQVQQVKVADAGTATVYLGGLPDGSYYIEMYDRLNNYRERQLLLIKK